MPKVLLINDGRNQDHIGTHLVMQVLLDAFLPDATIPVFEEPRDVSGFDFIIVNAEGSTHHNHKSYLYRDYGVPSAMINAVWQGNDPVDLGHFVYVSARESLSASALSACGVEAEIVPDVMLANDLAFGSGYGTVVSDRVNDPVGFGMTLKNYELFKGADRIVAGRFHAACLAILGNKPFSAWPSNTWKTEGMMLDAGLIEHYHPDRETATQNVPETSNSGEYLRDARSRISTMIKTVQRHAGLRS